MNVDEQIVAIHSKLDTVLTILKGGHDQTGRFNPGLSPRLDMVESRVAKLEGVSEKADEGRLTVARGAGIAIIGGLAGQAIGWIKDHIR